jgi:hypothetical protein
MDTQNDDQVQEGYLKALTREEEGLVTVSGAGQSARLPNSWPSLIFVSRPRFSRESKN